MTDGFAKDLQASVRDFYERCATSFSRTRNTLVWPEEKIIAAKIKPGMTVVDVGAGNGRFAKLLPQETRYIGFEPSAGFRDEAKGLDLRPGELPKISLDDATADITVCFAVFHHIPGIKNRKDAVDELIRITKHGGLIAVTSWHPEETEKESVAGGDPGDIWIPWTSGNEQGKRYVHLMDEKEWMNLWTRPEVTIEKIGLFGKEDWTENPAEARNWFVVAKRLSSKLRSG